MPINLVRFFFFQACCILSHFTPKKLSMVVSMAASEFYLIFNIYNYIMFPYSLPPFIHTWETIAPVVARFRCCIPIPNTHTRTQFAIPCSAPPKSGSIPAYLHAVCCVGWYVALTQSHTFPLLRPKFSLLPSPICEIKYFDTQHKVYVWSVAAFRSPFCVRVD